MNLAAPDTGAAVFGSIGAGGLALALTVLLVLGCRGRGKIRLETGKAKLVGFAAGTAYMAAGAVWANPEKFTQQSLAGLGVGQSGGPFGTIGMGAIALLLLIIMYFAPLKPGRAGILCILAAIVWATAGGLWALPGDLVGTAFVALGAMA